MYKMTSKSLLFIINNCYLELQIFIWQARINIRS